MKRFVSFSVYCLASILFYNLALAGKVDVPNYRGLALKAESSCIALCGEPPDNEDLQASEDYQMCITDCHPKIDFLHQTVNALQTELCNLYDLTDKTPPVFCLDCGNGVLEPLEECDDGNTNDGDGCSSECFIEIPCIPIEEVCNGIDDDCDGVEDNGFILDGIYDGDDGKFIGDTCGVGACQGGIVSCSLDGNTTICDTEYLASAETCDGLDNDCDGQVDEGLSFDLDNDGHTSIGSCSGTADDCDDNDLNNFPGNTEICDGFDNNCDDQIDEGWLPATDIDGDGYSAIGTCGSGDDCNDNDEFINPGIPENPFGALCEDGIDNDCDGYDSICFNP